jgi:hypothetical protein
MSGIVRKSLTSVKYDKSSITRRPTHVCDISSSLVFINEINCVRFEVGAEAEETTDSRNIIV